MKKKGTWGKNALWPIKGSRVSAAFKKNISSPHVWAPTLASGIINLADWDEKMSSWAYKENVLFGTHDNASVWSDTINDVLKYQMWIAPLLTPSNDEENSIETWALRKGKGYVVIGLATRTADAGRSAIATSTKRLRPNRIDNLSFPSGHATQAGARNTMISRTIDAVEMDHGLRDGLKVMNTTLAGAVLVARVEAKRHYPCDVLMGYALSSFLSGFVYDSLINYDPDHPESISFVPTKNQWLAQYTYGF